MKDQNKENNAKTMESAKLEETVKKAENERNSSDKKTKTEADNFWAERDEDYLKLLRNTLFAGRLGLHGEIDQDVVNMRLRGSFWMEYWL